MDSYDPSFRLAIYVATAVLSIIFTGMMAVGISTLRKRKGNFGRGESEPVTNHLTVAQLRARLIDIQNDLMAGGDAKSALKTTRSLIRQESVSGSGASNSAREFSQELPSENATSEELVMLLMRWISRLK